jgi:hypothetical protein
MTPSFATNDVPHSDHIDAMLAGEGCDLHAGSVKFFAQGDYFRVGKLGMAVMLALYIVNGWLASAPPFDGIRSVFLRSTGVEVGRVNAAWAVAAMKAIKPFRDGSVLKLIGEAMGLYVRALRSFACVDMAVPVLIAACCPVPASCTKSRMDGTILVDLGPKSTFRRRQLSDLVVVSSDEANILALDVSDGIIAALRYGRILSAPAEAFAGWIHWSHLFFALVPIYVAKGFTLDPARFSSGLGGGARFAATPAMAKSWFNFVREFVRGMLCHVSSSFQLFTVPRAISSSAVAFRVQSSIIAQPC